MAANRRRNLTTAVTLFAVAGGMVGMAFAAVPLYRLFCQVTGYGGTPGIEAAAPAPATAGAPKITVRFDANVNSDLPWRFRPAQTAVTVPVGEETLVFYTARNDSDVPVTGTATFNVTPYKAGPYFSKVQCFCFTEQRLEPGEDVSMAVSFFVDPEILKDPNTTDVKTITLSYTFFRASDQDGARTAGKPGVAPNRG